MKRLIDADALLKLFPDEIDGLQTYNAEVQAIINSQPTIEAMPIKHGKWIETEFLKLRECSCCHVRWGMYDTENFTYCPDCGARMDGDA